MVKRSRPENISTPSTSAKQNAAPAKKPRLSRPSDTAASRDGLAALKDVQARFARAVMTPLTDDWTMQPRTPDGQPTADVVAQFVKPNDRLTSFERVELYNRQYWFRLIDVMYEDYAGLAAILGQDRFNRFCGEYLTAHPSRSGLLRNLGRHLVSFIEKRPELTAPRTDMALSMARFEWAQVEAFDAPARPPLRQDDLLGKNPADIRVSLQPAITLLELDYAVDRLLLAVKRQVLRSEASNASEGIMPAQGRRRSARREKTHLIIHRLNNMVYNKRLEPEAFAILSALQGGATLLEAIAGATPEDVDPVEWATRVREWFKLWMSFAWFC